MQYSFVGTVKEFRAWTAWLVENGDTVSNEDRHFILDDMGEIVRENEVTE